ncbi:MAG: type II toxin-antitoxin system RelE/ParE family toxin [Gammaproteobacteria bacterium]|nr:type II toxin-antitoxin system RelE/ParE family toxin [Gammaproteobacteria bacterium]
MQTFKTKAFARFADREGVRDAALCEAVRRVRAGAIDADLGGGVIKQRIARRGGGRSGGIRAIMLFRRGELAFFVYGFAKSSRKNLRRDELKVYRRLADEMLNLADERLEAALANRTIIEVICDE